MTHRKHLLFLCSALLLWAGSSLAQDDDAGMECTICFDEGLEITETIESSRELLDEIREAEIPVREYIERSLKNGERGSARALRDFSVWYKYRVAQQNARELEQKTIATLVGRGLSHGLNFFLPGSGTVATHLRSVGQKTYDALAGTLPAGNSDPGPYLEKLAERMENDNDHLQNWLDDMFHDTENQELQDQIETVKLEYVIEKKAQRLDGDQGATQRTPGPGTRSLLRSLGIQPPTSRNYERVRRAVLEQMMLDVFCVEASSQRFPIKTCRADGAYFEALAKSQMLRLVLTGVDPAKMNNLTDAKHLETVCPVEWPLGMHVGNDCRRWRTRPR